MNESDIILVAIYGRSLSCLVFGTLYYLCFHMSDDDDSEIYPNI